MGRIKSLQPAEAAHGIHSLFSVRYRRLVDDNNTTNFINNNVSGTTGNGNGNSSGNSISGSGGANHQRHPNNLVVASNLLRMKLSQDYIAYCCGQCGHHQRLDIKAEDLQTIGDVLRASSSESVVISSSDAKTVKNTSWTRQFHDKSRQSKTNNIQTAAVDSAESNFKEMNKCKCAGKDAKTPIKAGSGGASVGHQKSGAALVMPFHAHHPLIMGYKPLLSSLDLATSASKVQNAPSSSPSSTSSSCQSSRSATPSSSSADGYLPTLPVRSDSLTNLEEEELLKCAPWFQAGIPREISLEILRQEPVGSFLVRQSTSKPGCYALSVRVPPKDGQKANIAHYLITQSNRGFKIKGFTKEFPSLTSLIVHHSVMPELLPCPLLLHRATDGLLADYLEHANNFVDIDSSVLLELTRKSAE